MDVSTILAGRHPPSGLHAVIEIPVGGAPDPLGALPIEDQAGVGEKGVEGAEKLSIESIDHTAKSSR